MKLERYDYEWHYQLPNGWWNALTGEVLFDGYSVPDECVSADTGTGEIVMERTVMRGGEEVVEHTWTEQGTVVVHPCYDEGCEVCPEGEGHNRPEGTRCDYFPWGM